MANSPNKLQDNNTPVTSNSETVASLTEVTSSSPTQSSSSNAAFQPFQQLHEAVLAAVNSNGMPISHHSFFAAAAAVAAATNANALPANPQIKPEIDIAKKESIRASNRERKKKWRIHNEERNKDNDLRCRVNKRASKLFGNEDSPAKQNWVKEEFEKRRQKRIDKERRKMIVNNALSVPPGADTTSVSTAHEDHNMSNIVTHAQLPSFYPPLPQIDNAAAAKLLDFPADLQRQLLEQLNNSMLALTNGIQQTTSKVEEIKQEVMNDVNNPQSTASPSSTIAEVHIPTSTIIPNDSSIALSNTNTTNSTDQVSDMEIDSTCNNNNNNNNNNSNSNNDNNNDNNNNNNNNNNNSTDNNNNNNNSNGTDTQAAEVENNKENSNNIKEEIGNQSKDSQQGNEENKTEYPMDTVLTLMQLNAGWKQ